MNLIAYSQKHSIFSIQEIVYFKGNESANNISFTVTEELKSCQFILYVSANNSHPDLNMSKSMNIINASK